MTSNPKTQDDKTEVEIVRHGYQPNRAELKEDLRVDATFDEAVQALAKPVKIKYTKTPKGK